MGILYGAMIACLIPVLVTWWQMPTAWVWQPVEGPVALRWSLTVMAVGVLILGLRDLYAALGLPGGGWPWTMD